MIVYHECETHPVTTVAIGGYKNEGPASENAAPANESTRTGDDSKEQGEPNGAAQENNSATVISNSYDLSLIKDSISLIEPSAEKFAAYFCGRLFADNPQLRGMFPSSMAGHGERLLRSIDRIVWNLDSPQAFESYLMRLGHDHRKFGVAARHYGAVCEAILATVRLFAGTAWSDEVKRAWQAAFQRVAEIMTKGMEEKAETEPPWWLGEVLAHRTCVPDIAIVTVRPNQPLLHRAGQYVHVQCARWPRVWRKYSIANAPRSDGLLEFHVRAIPGGWVSGAIVYHTKPGDVLLLGPASGEMIPEVCDSRNVLCIAGGTGLAPIKAIVEHFVAESQPGGHRSIHLFFGARTRADLYDLDSLRRMESSYPPLRVTPVVSEEAGFDGPRGRLPGVVAGYQSWAGHDVYVSGPGDMIRETVRALTGAGVPAARIHSDPAGLDV